MLSVKVSGKGVGTLREGKDHFTPLFRALSGMGFEIAVSFHSARGRCYLTPTHKHICPVKNMGLSPEIILVIWDLRDILYLPGL